MAGFSFGKGDLKVKKKRRELLTRDRGANLLSKYRIYFEKRSIYCRVYSIFRSCLVLVAKNRFCFNVDVGLFALLFSQHIFYGVFKC